MGGTTTSGIVRHARRVLVTAVLAIAGTLVVPAVAGATVDVWFVQGEQLVKVARPGTTSLEAGQALLAGPTAAEKAKGIRTYVPSATPLRSLTLAGDLATIDLGNRFVAGTQDTESDLARLSQLVYTLTGPEGVKRVQLLIDGGVVFGLFPGVQTDQPVTIQLLQTPDITPPTNPPGSSGGADKTVRASQQRLADLGYLRAADVNGKLGPATTAAVIAFQKWERLGRDGVIGPLTRARLQTAKRPTPRTTGSGRRAEVLLDRQVTLAIENNKVVRIIHVSSGASGTPTRVGTFKVLQKYQKWWSVPFRSWLPWAIQFDGGIAFHEYSPVPNSPASHGCVRNTSTTAKWLYDFLRVGNSVKVIAKS